MLSFAVVTATIAGIIGTATLLGAHDWLPKLLRRDVDPPESYIWGVALGILLPILGWLAFWYTYQGPDLPVLLAALAILLIITLAGSGTLGAYRIDRHHAAHLTDALHQSRLDLARQTLADYESRLQPESHVPASVVHAWLIHLRETLASHEGQS